MQGSSKPIKSTRAAGQRTRSTFDHARYQRCRKAVADPGLMKGGFSGDPRILLMRYSLTTENRWFRAKRAV